MIYFTIVQQRAANFLEVADMNSERVSNYMNGSTDINDLNAYNEVKDAEENFLMAYNEYYCENQKACLNYELADSVMPY